jgi:hypothetical protein
MTRQISKAFTLTAALMLGTSATQAQNVDIGLFETGTELEVRVRPSEDFDGILSAVVFTVRWERSTTGALLEHQQKSSAGTYIPIARSGELHQDGPFNYQIYAGFGFDLVGENGGAWKAGQEYVIATIPHSGKGGFTLVNDGWTNIDENNGDYYLSLNGHDRTGIIYKGLANVTNNDQVVSISPNPNRGIFTLSVPVKTGDNMSLEIINTAGQIVFQDSPRQVDGQYRREMDISSHGAGNYNLRIVRNGVSENHKIIVQ